MAEAKRYYWLKLKDDFFSSKRIKKLRKLAGGDTYTIIYLKMQLLSVKTNGVLTYTGLENSFAEELALDIDEDIENVQITLTYLASCGLIETSDNIEYLLPFVVENTGSETASAQRVRDFRSKQALHCNTPVTQVKRTCNAEIDIEKDIEKDKRYISRFKAPNLEDVEQYITEKGYKVDAKVFFDYYSEAGWKDSDGKPVKNWKQRVVSWNSRAKNNKPQTSTRFSNFDERKDDLDSGLANKILGKMR